MNNHQFSQNLVDNFFKYDYHDRGMIKWQGFYLSDHTTAIDKQENKLNRLIKLEQQQSTLKIKKNLYASMLSNRKIVIQLNQINGELNPIEIESRVSKLNDINVQLSNDITIDLENIRNVRI